VFPSSVGQKPCASANFVTVLFGLSAMKLQDLAFSLLVVFLLANCVGLKLKSLRGPGAIFVVYCVDTESNAFNYG